MKTSKCGSCGADVIWTTTKNGKAMPVDAAPSDTGNIRLVPAADPREAPLALMIPGGPRPEVRYLSHFVSCPFADEHRKKK